MSETGLKCLHWNSTEVSPYLGVEEVQSLGDDYGTNYCRNPAGKEERPWCFTSSFETDYCDVPHCQVEEGKIYIILLVIKAKFT